MTLQEAVNAGILVADPPDQFTKTVAAAGTPEALSATSLVFRKATLIGKKAARTNNTGIVYLGMSATNDTQPIEIAAGAVTYISAPAGTAYNFQDFYLDCATAGDGVVVIYN